MASSEPVQFQNSTNFFTLFCGFFCIAAVGVVIVSAGIWSASKPSSLGHSDTSLGKFNANQLSNRLITDDLLRKLDESLRMDNEFKSRNLSTSRVRYVKSYLPSQIADETFKIENQPNPLDKFAMHVTDSGKVRITVLPRSPKLKVESKSRNEIPVILVAENTKTFDQSLPK